MEWINPIEYYPYGSEVITTQYKATFMWNNKSYEVFYSNVDDTVEISYQNVCVQKIKKDKSSSDFEYIKSLVEANWNPPNYTRVPESILLQLQDSPKLEYLQYLVIAGSVAYGTNSLESDLDIRGWYFPSVPDLLGLSDKRWDSFQLSYGDTVLYTFHKFMKGLTKCNPNFLEQLGVNDTEILYESDLAKWLRQNQSKFLSKQVFFTFGGYANSMLKQIEGVEPCVHRNRKQGYKLLKHASHLIRLYFTGIDILLHGYVTTYRDKECDLLKSIKTGEYPLDKVFELKDKLEVKLRNAYDKSWLPEYCNQEYVNQAVVDLVSDYLSNSQNHKINWVKLGL